MGSVTNLLENKTLFIPCDCKENILSVEYDHNKETANFAVYANISSHSYRMSFWQRLRRCYLVLVNNKPFIDQITLDKKQLTELKLFLNSLNS